MECIYMCGIRMPSHAIGVESEEEEEKEATLHNILAHESKQRGRNLLTTLDRIKKGHEERKASKKARTKTRRRNQPYKEERQSNEGGTSLHLSSVGSFVLELQLKSVVFFHIFEKLSGDSVGIVLVKGNPNKRHSVPGDDNVNGVVLASRHD